MPISSHRGNRGGAWQTKESSKQGPVREGPACTVSASRDGRGGTVGGAPSAPAGPRQDAREKRGGWLFLYKIKVDQDTDVKPVQTTYLQ